MIIKKETKDSFTIVLIWTVRLAWLISILVMITIMTDSFTQSPIRQKYLLTWVFLIAGTIGMHGLTKILSELKT